MIDDDAPTDSKPQPRDSRLEAFLRRAAGILAEHRQWSAQTQIKLKSLAKELGLPPELFQTALEQLADTGHVTPPTRYEKAFCDYLEKQFEALPGEILARTQERKALLYGQQKFQLAPDVCERCIARVAADLNIARISDEQAVAYAQGEVSRLVGKAEQSKEELLEQVHQLAQRWGLEPLQAERLLNAEIERKRSKRRRATFYRWGIGVGVGVLSLVLIASIVALGRILTPQADAVVERDGARLTDSENKTGATVSSQANRPITPAWWTNNHHNFLARLDQEGLSADLLAGLISENGVHRGEAYRQLWRQLAQWDRQLVQQASEQPRWLRQAVAQEALLDWFWNEPDLKAVQAWIEELQQLRAGEQPVASTDWREIPSASDDVVNALGDFLITTAAEHLLLRAYQRGLSEATMNPTLPGLSSKLDLLARQMPDRQMSDASASKESSIVAWRQRWVAEATERLYFRIQSQWPHQTHVGRTEHTSNVSFDARKRGVAAVSESLRLIPDESTRSRLLIMFWSAVAGIEPTLAEAAWPEVASAMEIVSPRDFGPLVESWSVNSAETEWSQRLLPAWDTIVQGKQKTLSGVRHRDAILLQYLMPTEPVPSIFQTRLRRQLLLSQIDHLEVNRAPTTTLHTDASWENLSRTVTLAYLLLLERDFVSFDEIAVQATSLAGSPQATPGQVFVPFNEFNEVWNRLTTARDLDGYQQAVQRITSWWREDRLLSIPQAQRLTTYLAGSLKPEEQTSWLIELKTLDSRVLKESDTQAKNSSIDHLPMGRPLLSLIVQPSVAIALADSYELDWQKNSMGLAWLGPSSVDPGQPNMPSDDALLRSESNRWVQWLRQQAARQLQQRAAEAVSTFPRQLAQRYQTAFRSQRRSQGASANSTWQIATATNQVNHPLLEILLVHDQWSESVAKIVLEDPDPWLAEYRGQVDQQATLEQALWVAEFQVLQLFKKLMTEEPR